MKTKLAAILAVIATASAEPIPNVDKLTTRAVGMGKKKVIEITAKADTEPLVIVWGTRKEDRSNPPTFRRRHAQHARSTRRTARHHHAGMSANHGQGAVDGDCGDATGGMLHHRVLPC